MHKSDKIGTAACSDGADGHADNPAMTVQRAERIIRLNRIFWRVVFGPCLAVVLSLGFVFALNYNTQRRLSCISIQGEAKTMLKVIFIAQEEYRGEHDRYTTDLEQLSFGTNSTNLRYNYSISRASSDSFLAVAQAYAAGRNQGDSWTIDEGGRSEHIAGACR